MMNLGAGSEKVPLGMGAARAWFQLKPRIVERGVKASPLSPFSYAEISLGSRKSCVHRCVNKSLHIHWLLN